MSKREIHVWKKSDIFFQAEDGIRDQPRSRGLGDVYKNQVISFICIATAISQPTGYRINGASFKFFTQDIFLIFVVTHYNFVGLGSFLYTFSGSKVFSVSLNSISNSSSFLILPKGMDR